MRRYLNMFSSFIEFAFSIILFSFIVGMILNWNFFSGYVLIILTGVLTITVYKFLMFTGTREELLRKILVIVTPIISAIFLSAYTEFMSYDSTEVILEFQRTFPNTEWTVIVEALPIGLRDVILVFMTSLYLNKNINTDIGHMGIAGYDYADEYASAIYNYNYSLSVTQENLRNLADPLTTLVIILTIGSLFAVLVENIKLEN